ncbi:MAG: hypothetical protein M1827_001593 [Pycnora praestabilis]|nr:MAG: hypothetical protein M1827_001593 [Pycnora praestabilis]
MADSMQPGPAEPPQQHASQQNIKDEALSCQWNGCGERCNTAEELYDHVCERHVGRKSTNNLNLTCAWGTCRTTTVKRDHITSHIRVHVPLKPHKCDFCGKAFKRPQDLKKHVKTHADDSVLTRSPEPNAGQRQRDVGYGSNNGNGMVDLQSLAATAAGYYENPLQHPGPAFGHHPQNSNPNYYGAQQQPNSSYGPVYYAVSGGGDAGNSAAFDPRKRDYDVLNNFFGDAKRRQIDPTSYADVGQRLVALQGLQIPVQSGNILADYQASPAMIHAGGDHGPMPQHQYSLPPMPNLRTKNDLMNVDQFLEQMQSTVYESSNHAAAAGIAQPGAHYGLILRHSNSPPAPQQTSSHQMDIHQMHTGVSAPPMVATSSHSTHGGTPPGLTPPSSTVSYASAHSPGSQQSTQGISPHLRGSTSGLYPHLQGHSAATEMPGLYSQPASSAPSSSLGPAFDPDQRRRYSGGMLQKANNPSRADEDVDMSDSTASPPNATSPEASSDRGEALADKVKNFEITTDLIDPELSSLGQTESRESAADKAQEAWVDNIRVIEALRKFIAERLEKGQYDDSDDGTMKTEHEDEVNGGAEAIKAGRREMTEVEKDAESLYPVLRAMEADD